MEILYDGSQDFSSESALSLYSVSFLFDRNLIF